MTPAQPPLYFFVPSMDGLRAPEGVS